MDVQRDLTAPHQLFIGGVFVDASDGGTFQVTDSATERSLGAVADGTVEDAEAAVAAAAAALPAWAALAPRARAEILRRTFELIVAQQEPLARLITRENGKSLADSRAEMAYAAEFFRWYSEEAVRNIGQVSRAPSSGARILVQHKPAGVAVLVTPWNFPAAMGTRKIAPALAAGCTMIVTPASEAPLTMLALAPLLEEAGVPRGVVNMLPSRRSSVVVNAMLKDPRVRVVSFTGSTETGRRILRSAADAVVSPRMELGGNAPFIVLEDADLDAAVAGAMVAKMRNIGEACTAANRFYVHEQVHDEFVARLARAMGELKVGNGLEAGIAVGPLVNAETRDKVETLVEDARSRGAKVETGGRRLSPPGYFYAPTVLSHVPDDALCLREEIFGPVAPVQSFADEEQLVTRANATEYGLVAYLYTRDLARGLALSERLEAGMVGLNRGIVSDPAAPLTQYISVSW